MPQITKPLSFFFMNASKKKKKVFCFWVVRTQRGIELLSQEKEQEQWDSSGVVAMVFVSIQTFRKELVGKMWWAEGHSPVGTACAWRRWLLNEVPLRWGDRLPVYLTDSCLCHFSFPPVLHQLENWCCSPPVSKEYWKMTKMLAFVC